MENQNTVENLYISSPVRQMEFFQTEQEALAIQDELIERYITPPPSPRLTMPPVIQRVLIDSGAFDRCESYLCYGHETDCYGPQSDCDNESSNHGVPAFSPITLPNSDPMVVIAEAQKTIAECVDEIDAWVKSLEALIADSKAIRETPLSAFANLACHHEDDDSEMNIEEL
jgi:hypothetical protein